MKRVVGLALVPLVLAAWLPLAQAAGRSRAWLEPPVVNGFDVGRAPVVVVGVAGGSRSIWHPAARNITTVTRFRVEQVQRGDVTPGSTIRIETLGGTANGITQTTEYEPAFTAGERSRLFLAPEDRGAFRLYGAVWGKQDAGAGPRISTTCLDAGNVAKNGFCLRPYLWPFDAWPLHWSYNTNKQPLSGALNAIKAAFGTWEKDGSSRVDFAYDGTTCTKNDTSSDGTNCVFWAADSLFPGALGRATNFNDGSAHSFEFDIRMNTLQSWATGSSPSKYDIQSVATHEIGHVLGFGHIDNGAQVMAPYLAANSTKRKLGAGDVNGVRYLYPSKLPRMTGDFDGDGLDDVMAFGPGDATYWVGLSDGSSFGFVEWADMTPTDGWTRHLAGDFNGDGKDDIASFYAPSAKWFVSRLSGGVVLVAEWADLAGTSWGAPIVGDVNGDGKDDIANFRTTDATWWVSKGGGSSFAAASQWADLAPDTGWGTRLAGDFSGDGKDDVAAFNTGTGEWVVGVSNGSTAFTTSAWATLAAPASYGARLAADFDGDLDADVANFKTADASWRVNVSTGTVFDPAVLWADLTPDTGWGAPVAGDFDDDGKVDIANFKTADATWRVGLSSGSVFAAPAVWADLTPDSTGWTTPLVGDFDGNGVRDVAIFRETTSAWWVGLSTGTAFATTQWADL